MSDTPSQVKNTPSGIERGKKYRFVVSSAEEAITTLRERLGSDAKVISVKQIGGEGLSRFLSSPKLEVIATLPEIVEEEEISEPPPVAEAPKPATPPPAASARDRLRNAKHPKAAGKEVSETTPAREAPRPVADPQRDELDAELSDPTPPPARVRQTTPYARQEPTRTRPPSTVWSVLKNAGFDDSLLGSLRYVASAEGPSIDEMPLPRALAEVNRRLRMEYQAIEMRPPTSRIAFFGTPGVGKTTALCKRLSNDVFIGRKSVEVLKLDSDTPNPDDALCLFCDVLGVPLQRDSGQKRIDTQSDLLYVDLPGMPMGERDQWLKLRQRLDILGVDTRVLVVNGMYEASLIGAAFDLGERMGATHLAVTHMDEITSAAKLWTFIVRGRLCPLFASHGQNVTSDYSEDILRLLLEKTFPTSIIE